MSNEKNSGAHYRVRSRTPTIPDYRPLVETDHGRLTMPARATVEVDVTGTPDLARVVVEVALIDRRYRIIRLEAAPHEGGGLDLEQLRGLPIALWLRSGLAHLTKLESTNGATYTAESPIDDPDPLWPVALTYSVAYALGENPTAAVAEHLGVSTNAAAQRVKRAREAGYLPTTTAGRAS